LRPPDSTHRVAQADVSLLDVERRDSGAGRSEIPNASPKDFGHQHVDVTGTAICHPTPTIAGASLDRSLQCLSGEVMACLKSWDY
jgi:hypothetical protein